MNLGPVDRESETARVVRAQRFDDAVVEGVGQQRVGVQHEQCLAFGLRGAGGDGGAAAARRRRGFYVKVELPFYFLDNRHRVVAASGINHNDLTSTRPAGRLRDASQRRFYRRRLAIRGDHDGERGVVRQGFSDRHAFRYLAFQTVVAEGHLAEH